MYEIEHKSMKWLARYGSMLVAGFRSDDTGMATMIRLYLDNDKCVDAATWWRCS